MFWIPVTELPLQLLLHEARILRYSFPTTFRIFAMTDMYIVVLIFPKLLYTAAPTKPITNTSTIPTSAINNYSKNNGTIRFFKSLFENIMKNTHLHFIIDINFFSLLLKLFFLNIVYVVYFKM